MAGLQCADELVARLLEARRQAGVGGRAHGVPVAAVAQRREDVLRHAFPVAVEHAPLDRAAEVVQPVGELRAARDSEDRRADVRRENQEVVDYILELVMVKMYYSIQLKLQCLRENLLLKLVKMKF